MMLAAVHLSPVGSRALGRAVSRIVGILIRDLGWGWGLTAAGGMMLAGWAAWTAPTWAPALWDAVCDWFDE